MVNQSNRVFAY